MTEQLTGASAQRPEVLWRPTPADVDAAGATAFMRWLTTERGVDLMGDPDALWRWSVEDLEAFWAAVWDYFDIVSSAPYERVLDRRAMPGARWFEGSLVNYAEHVLRAATDARPALLVLDESGESHAVSWAELTRDVAALARTLREAGVRLGDRVCGYLSNVPEAVVAFLAAASLGAVWAVCAPDFGLAGVIDRFAPLAPTVLVAVDGYRFGGRTFQRNAELEQLRSALPSVRLTIVVPKLSQQPSAGDVMPWAEAVAVPAEHRFERVPFDHPLWVLFSSGTTGMPKGIVHSHVGILLEQYKQTALGLDLRAGDRLYIFSSTSWMVWNTVVGTLLCGVVIVLYDGSPGHPDVLGNWRVAATTSATVFCSGSAYLSAVEKSGRNPAAELDLSALRTVIATGSVLPPSTWGWIYGVLGPRIRLDSSSGGTDVCSGLIGGNVLKPVVRGELTGPYLGVNAQTWDPHGRAVVDQVGELVITEPMPSMPLQFWDDPDGRRFQEAYFDVYPGAWRHGDWVRTTNRGSMVIEGRSDSTLNKAGVRMGSADIYAAVEPLDGVADSLVVGVDVAPGAYYMPLFVVCAPGRVLDDGLRDEILRAVRERLTPRHVPDEVIEAPAIPRTRTGKKLEVPIRRILAGAAVDEATSLAAVDDADAVRWYAEFAAARAAARDLG